MTQETKEELQSTIVNGESLNDLVDVVDATISAFCAHPETRTFNYAEIISALTHLMAVYANRGGCTNEERMLITKGHLATNFENSVRDLWEQDREARETNKDLQ